MWTLHLECLDRNVLLISNLSKKKEYCEFIPVHQVVLGVRHFLRCPMEEQRGMRKGTVYTVSNYFLVFLRGEFSLRSCIQQVNCASTVLMFVDLRGLPKTFHFFPRWSPLLGWQCIVGVLGGFSHVTPRTAVHFRVSELHVPVTQWTTWGAYTAESSALNERVPCILA